MNESEYSSERQQLVHAIAALEAQRGVLGDAVVDPMIAAAREKLDALEFVGSSSPDLRGERRQATILMTDVEGSTKSVCVPTLSLTGSFTPARISRGRRSDLSRFRCG
jgi:hypothetical protein